MFIGHFAVGFAAKRATPRTSLGTLILAALFLDALWPVFLLLGIERARIDPGNTAFTPLAFDYYPFSHSLLMAIVWGILFALAYNARGRYSRGALWVCICVVSHWILDFVTHRPDLPLYPGGPKVGLGLWNSRAATMTVEGAMFVAAIWLYAVTTRARITMVAIIGIVAWLFVLWAYWIDRNREAKAAA